MLLSDDNFATIRAAVEEGRRVYDNLVKALTFVLPTSVGQGLIIAVAVLAVPFSDRLLAGGFTTRSGGLDAGPRP
jgi:magnesium-transporting ATPase (P-type)